MRESSPAVARAHSPQNAGNPDTDSQGANDDVPHTPVCEQRAGGLTVGEGAGRKGREGKQLFPISLTPLEPVLYSLPTHLSSLCHSSSATLCKRSETAGRI